MRLLLILAALFQTTMVGPVKVAGPVTAPKATSTTPTFVQGIGSTGSPSTSLNYGSTVTAANALYAMAYFGGGSGATITFTDSQSNSWSTVTSASLATDGDTIAIGCAIAGTSGFDEVTANNGVRMVLYEVHGATCTPDVTPVSSNTTGATSCNSGPMTTSTANDLLIGFCGTDGSQTATWTGGSGWSNVFNYSTGSVVFGLGEIQVGTTPGSYTATSAAFPTTSGEQATIIVAFKP
jgi:hypothetical protein